MGIRGKRIIVCKNCGCKYEMRSRLYWIVECCLSSFFAILFVPAFFFMIVAYDNLSKFLGLETNHFLELAIPFVVNVIVISIAFELFLLPLYAVKKTTDEEQR
jgi:hypothetical protein